MELDIGRLKKKRTALKSSTSKLMKKIEESKNSDDSSKLDELLNQLLSKIDNIKILDNQIVDLIDVNEIETEIEISEEYSEKLIANKCLLQRRINELCLSSENAQISVQQNQVSVQSQAISNSTPAIKLPRLNLNRFYGDPSTFLEFYGQFENAIHKNKSLSKVEKLIYLKNLVGGSASSCIKGLELKDKNYDSALEILQSRYGNKDVLIQAHLGSLLNISPIKNSDDLNALRNMYDKIETQIRNLESLSIDTKTYANLLTPIIIKLLPSDLTLEFTRKTVDEHWSLQSLLEFLKKELLCKERASLIHSEGKCNKQKEHLNSHSHNCSATELLANSQRPKYDFKHFKSSKLNATYNINRSSPINKHRDETGSETLCVFHKNDNHESSVCELDLGAKREIIRKEGRCWLCLRKFCRKKKCSNNIKCGHCGSGSHNQAFCFEYHKSLHSAAKANSETIVSNVTNGHSEIFLQTAAAQFMGKKGNNLVRRIIFDGGSQRTFLESKLARELKLPVIGQEILTVHTFQSERPTKHVYPKVRIRVRSLVSNKEIVIEALETKQLSSAYIGIPGKEIREKFENLGLALADVPVTSGKGVGDIGLLVGSDNYWKFVGNRIERLDESLVAVETILGFCIHGSVSEVEGNDETLMNLAVSKESISDQLSEFWRLENLGIEVEDMIDVSEHDILKSFESSIEYSGNRYTVRLPWKSEIKHLLGDNRSVALDRHSKLVKRFNRDNSLFQDYKKILDDYVSEGIIESVMETPKLQESYPTFYLPHTCVKRLDKTTTKIRIVFDGSSHSENQLSLNDCLYSGVNLNPDLLELILKFRENPIAYTADIEKAFLQIELHEQDRDVARFFWTDNPSDYDPESLQVYRLTRVLFGLTSSPFMLAATIRHHLKKYKDKFPVTVKILESSLYVDDFISGQESVDAALQTSLESIDIFKEAGMSLRKWHTNSKDLEKLWIENKVPVEESNSFSEQGVVPLKVLGICWDNKTDSFYFDVSKLVEFMSKNCCTKRFVLQAIARIFDPVGFLSPIVIRMKILLQDIWISGIDWDEDLPCSLKSEWIDLCSQIPELKSIHIPRYYLWDVTDDVESLSLHSFSDSSKRGYGCVVYLRVVCKNGNIRTSFVASKSRVSPLKAVSLPRLELLGALLSVRLASRIAKIFKYESAVTYWTDSTIVYCWVRSLPDKYKPFVKNRVEEIQKLSDPSDWNHCPGKENPADFLTRGLSVNKLVKCEAWWNGPHWLRQPKEYWPKVEVQGVEEDNLELKKKFEKTIQNQCVLEANDSVLDLKKYSKLSKMLRVTAWILRFLTNCRRKDIKDGYLHANEIEQAELYWIKKTQREFYSSEILALEKQQPIRNDSKIRSLVPILDSDNVLRISTRLEEADLATGEKQPILLPAKSRFTELLVMREHTAVFHCGVSATLTQIRRKFWIPKARQLVKRIIKSCVVCRKYSAKPADQMTAQLPRDRIAESAPFEIVGIDFAGPIFVKDDKQDKAYIALFTCAVTRAVHLELVSSMTTKCFLLALRRFFSRRGNCKVIYSDNFRTFKTAQKELNHLINVLKDSELQGFVANKKVLWKFIADRAPWWGGFYERMVKTVKEPLRKILGRSLLSFEELTTLLTEIEDVVNLRPLTYVSDDKDEPEPLTPAHFLHFGRNDFDYPIQFAELFDRTVTKETLRRRKLYQTVLLKRLWTRWKEQYLLQLRTAHNFKNPIVSENLKTGDVVLVEGTTKSKLLWQLGRIQEVLIGRDNNIRACIVKTSKGLVRRPIQMLYPLELNYA